MEFGGSGEDSFVAVVVTKLTGALLFILLLTMVIMALLPKAVDLPSSPGSTDKDDASTLAITTPEELPEAIAGRPYRLALASDGGRGHVRWSLDEALPAGLAFTPEIGLISGTPSEGTPVPVVLTLSASDGTSRASSTTRLVVYRPDSPLSTPSTWAPSLPAIPWREWLEHGFGFVALWLVHLVGLSTLDGLRNRSVAGLPDDEIVSARRRFNLYKAGLSLITLAAAIGLAGWLWMPLK